MNSYSNPYNNPFFPSMKRVAQKNEVFCGPAVLEMLASYVGYYIDQEEIVKAVGLKTKIYDRGMLVPEIAKAVNILLPNLNFWYKEHATITDLSRIVNEFHFPVGVEWQGVFYEDEDEDNGHYSVVTHVDTQTGIMMISDPYERFAGTDRKFPIREFDERWWDDNDITDPVTGEINSVKDDHLMFIVTPYESSFPEIFYMKNE